MKYLLACLFFIAHGDIILGQDDQWRAFKKQYNKRYSPEDEINRRETFKLNLEVSSSL